MRKCPWLACDFKLFVVAGRGLAMVVLLSACSGVRAPPSLARGARVCALRAPLPRHPAGAVCTPVRAFMVVSHGARSV